MKYWSVEASAPICGTTTYYGAISNKNPEELQVWGDNLFPYIAQELWDNYSWALHLDDEEYASQEEEDEAYDEAWEEWLCDCEVKVEETTEEEIEDLEIIYNENEK